MLSMGVLQNDAVLKPMGSPGDSGMLVRPSIQCKRESNLAILD